MNIGDASKIVGLPVKTVRYCTDIGLIVAQRSENGHRSGTVTRMQTSLLMR